MSNRALTLFCVLAYALSWSIQFEVIAAYGNPENPHATPWLVAIMFTPALVTLAFAFFSRKARAIIRWRQSWRMLPLLIVAFVVPTLISFGTVAAIDLFGWGKPGWFVFSQSGVAISGGPWLLGNGTQAWGTFALNVFLTGGCFAALNALAAMGEELGWRGFLQGPLVEKLDATRGIVLLGLIWSFWHLPALLAGYNFPAHPMLGAFLLSPLELIAVSMFLGWLTIRSGSFWCAAIAHGAGNSIEEGVTANLHMQMPHIYEDIARLTFTMIFGLLFWFLLARGSRPTRAEPLMTVQSSLAPNVSQSSMLPLARPRRNHFMRCADVPCVKESGTT
jgi:uncharacterized protein